MSIISKVGIGVIIVERIGIRGEILSGQRWRVGVVVPILTSLKALESNIFGLCILREGISFNITPEPI